MGSAGLPAQRHTGGHDGAVGAVDVPLVKLLSASTMARPRPWPTSGFRARGSIGAARAGVADLHDQSVCRPSSHDELDGAVAVRAARARLALATSS